MTIPIQCYNVEYIDNQSNEPTEPSVLHLVGRGPFARGLQAAGVWSRYFAVYGLAAVGLCFRIDQIRGAGGEVKTRSGRAES